MESNRIFKTRSTADGPEPEPHAKPAAGAPMAGAPVTGSPSGSDTEPELLPLRIPPPRPSAALPPGRTPKETVPLSSRLGGRPPREEAAVPPARPFRAGGSGGHGSHGRINWWTWVPTILFFGGAGLVLVTQSPMGFSWDEAYYIEPAQKAAEWIVKVAQGDRPFDAESIEYYWGERHEHPSVQKILSGLSMHWFTDTFGRPLPAARLPMAFLFGATLVLIYMLGCRAGARVGGLVAAVCFGCMPRVFGHAHFATMEPVLIFATVLVVYCFVRGMDSVWWAPVTGVAFGFLLATKINGFFMLPPLVLWGYLYGRTRVVHNFFFTAVLAPIVFIALWPWLWPDPVVRFIDYLGFHARHQQTALWFMGRKWGYGGENAPWFYPSAMIVVSTPLVTLALAAVGITGTLFSFWRRPLPALFLLVGLTQWAVASAPSTPKYDGVRLFLPLYPFLALLAGQGAHLVLTVARWSGDPRGEGAEPNIPLKFASWGIAGMLFVDSAWAEIRHYPYPLSYFNPLAGSVRGAEDEGFELTYWGEAVGDDAIDRINDVMPKGGALKVLALHEKCFLLLQKWGDLRSDIRIGGDPPFDAHLLLMRRGFFARPERALADANEGRFPRLGEWGKPGAPLLVLYQTGPEFEKFWPTAGAEPEPEPEPEPETQALPEPPAKAAPEAPETTPEKTPDATSSGTGSSEEL